MSIYKNEDGTNVLQFGTGDIEVCNGRTLTDNKKESWPTLVFISKEKGEIGKLLGDPDGPAILRSDAHTQLSFTKVESIDVVLFHLLQVKERMLKNDLKVLSLQEITDEIPEGGCDL